ncbi:short-chain dehydrogenase/reductase SDR [Pseudomonas synxantha BG33R]|nr:short-chain dehydrogenase/reductase SDR [Pseudomonas synxantha BG33R]
MLATQSRPEDLSLERMQRIFAVNAIGPLPVWLKVSNW